MEQLPKIAQQRLQATAKAGTHPDPDLLTAFAEKSLNERERTPGFATSGRMHGLPKRLGSGDA